MRNRIGVLITIFTFMLFLGIKHEIMAATTVPVTNFEEFKTWCEKPEDCDIWLTSNIAIQQSVRVVGNKKIYGSNNYYIDNWLLENGHVVANEPNVCLYILSGSNCTFYDIKYINGRNTSTNTSSAVVVYGGGTLTVNNTNFCYTAQGIHVDNGAVLNFNSGSIWGTSYAGIGSYRGNVYFNDGTIASDGQGLHNNGGNLNLIDGTISGKSIGLFTTGGGISNVKGGVIDSAQHGINNVDNGTVNIIGGKIRNNVYGIYNSANLNVKGGEIHNNSKVQIFNESKAVVSGGTMYSGSRGIENVGNLTVSGGIIRNHTAENGAGIYHNGSSCTITGGTFEENQDVYLAADDKFVITNESTPTFVVKPNTYTRGRKVVQTSSASNAINELSYLTLFPNSDWRLRAVNEDIRIWNKSTITINYLDESGEKLAESVIKEDWVDEEYTTSAKTISRYRVKSIPTNASGKYTDEEITINYVYEEDESEIEIQYVDKYTGTVLNTKTVKGIVGDSYTITPETIEGYESENLNDIVVEFERGKQIVLCNYVKVSKLTISYIDLNNENTKLTEDIVLNLKQKDTYTTEAKIFNGYTLTQQPINKTVTMERDNLTVTYGYKKNSLGVEVKYIDKFTGSEVATKITKTGLVGDTFTTSAKTVSGYELVTSPENSTVTMTEAKITLIYEYAKVSTITVKYIDLTNSNAKLADDIVVSKKQGDTYTTEAKAFNGYTLTQQPTNKTVTVERDNITVTYGYKKNSLGVEVKYIDKFTGTNIYETVTGTGFVGDTFIVEEKEKAGYEIVARPDSTNITMTESKITVTYEYAKLSNVKVIYKDITSNVDIETSIKEYKQGDEYTTTSKEFEGYVLSKTPTNNEGTVGREDITVIYEYKRTGKGVTIKYIDRSTKTDLVTPIIKTGNVGDAYTSEAKTIEGYELVKTPTNANGNIAEEAQEVIYEYAKVSTLTISYIDLTNSNVTLVDNIVEKLKEGDTYTLEAKTFNGYTLVEEPENNVVTMERKNITITYGYKKNSLGVEVKYIDKFTGSEIYPTVTQTGFVGDAFTVEEKEKAGYEIVTRPDSINITMTESKITVTYEYAKLSNVKVIYKDITSNVDIETSIKEYKQGDEYTTTSKEFEGYVLSKTPTNNEGTVGREDITVIYEYKRTGKGVTIKYVDRSTKTDLVTPIIKTGNVGDAYTSEAKTIEGYELVKTPTNANGNIAEEAQEVIYEYAKVSTLTISYIDLTNSNVTLVDNIVEKLKEGDTYTLEAKTFNGYTLVEEPENNVVTMERKNITITYGYKKNSLGVEVKYIDKFTGSEVYPTVTQTGFVGDTFTVEEKEKAGYEIVTRPDSINITMIEDKITVTYEYAKISTLTVKYVDENNKELAETISSKLKQGDNYTTEEKDIKN